MPKLTNPMEGLESFQPAFRAKQLDVRKGELDPSVWVHVDEPAAGTFRYTYARARGDKVVALVMIVRGEPIEASHALVSVMLFQRTNATRGKLKVCSARPSLSSETGSAEMD